MGILVIGELVDGAPTRLTLEVATAGRTLAAAQGTTAEVLVAGDDASAAQAIAAVGPDVVIAPAPAADVPVAASLAALAAARIAETEPGLVLIGASPDGKDVAGALVGLTELPVLVAGTGVSIGDGGVAVEMATFGGRLITTSGFTGERGIVLLRPGSLTASEADARGDVATIGAAEPALPTVRVADHVSEAARGPSIDDARVVVGGGRGVGSEEGFAVLADLADALDGAVGASRAAVDSGWIDFAQQIGQTGKTVKPELYIAAGISGAIQHAVGVRQAGTIVSINRDPDAPISELADLVVIGDLFEIVPRLTQALRDRGG